MRKRKRRAVSSSSSSSDDSSSDSEAPNQAVVRVPVKASKKPQPEPSQDPSSASFSSESESNSDSDSGAEPTRELSPQPASEAAPQQAPRRPRSPSPPPAPIPPFLPPKGVAPSEHQDEQVLKERFRKFWMASVADAFKDDLEEIRKVRSPAIPCSTSSKRLIGAKYDKVKTSYAHRLLGCWRGRSSIFTGGAGRRYDRNADYTGPHYVNHLPRDLLRHARISQHIQVVRCLSGFPEGVPLFLTTSEKASFQESGYRPSCLSFLPRQKPILYADLSVCAATLCNNGISL